MPEPCHGRSGRDDGQAGKERWEVMLGICMLAVVMLAALGAGFRLARGWSRNARLGGVLLFLLLGLSYFRWAYDSALVVSLLPPRLLPFAADWQVPLVAAGVGIFLLEDKLPRWRRGILGVLLLAVSLMPSVRMVIAPVPLSEEAWAGDVCRQTNPSTCSAAAAATVLRVHGITASEPEMITRCYTRKDGTSLAGLVHGLAAKARPAGKKTGVASLTMDDLKEAKHGPMILLVRLRQEVADREPRYENQWGWTVDLSHAVVFFGFTAEGNPVIGDPSVGRELWSWKGLDELWTGTAVWLE